MLIIITLNIDCYSLKTDLNNLTIDDVHTDINLNG